MTLVVGLKGANGVVLASDSQATHGELRASQPKLFETDCGLIWGSAGPYAGTQDLYTALMASDLPPNPGREETKAAIREALMVVARKLVDDTGARPSFEGLFAWYDATDGRHYLLRGWGNGRAEFEHRYGSIGSVASFGRFGFARSEFLELGGLPLEAAKMVAHMVAEDVVRASARGVDLPIQIATASCGLTQILRPDELQAISDTAGAFREAQRELLDATGPGQQAAPPKPGIRPGEI